ncbi:MAG: AEC family transporter [Clostridia bacterium]|nr:AEC family transporter [Clostridia bacterium]
MSNSASKVVEQVIILFFVMICGIFARKTNIIDRNSTKSLTKLLVSITQCFLMISSFQVEFSEELLNEGLWVMLLSFVIHVLLIVLCLFAFNMVKDTSKRKIYRFGTIFGNCGYLGFPVLNAIFGNIGVFYGAFLTFIFNILAWTYGVIIIRSDSQTKGFDKSQLKNIVNPVTISSFIGILLFIFQIKIPSPLIDGIDMVGDMTFPLSMIVVGSLIADTNLRRILKNPYIYYLCFVKLIAFPIIAILLCKAAGLSRTLSYIAIVIAAVPPSTVTAAIPELYGQDSVLGAEIVGISTVISVATIPFIIYLSDIII